MTSYLRRVLALLPLLVAASSASAEFKWSRPEQIAFGVTVSRCETTEPRAMRIAAVKVDLKLSGVAFTGSGRAPEKVYGQPLPEAKTLYNGKGEKFEPAEIRTVRRQVASFFMNCAMPTDKGGRGLDMLVAFNSVPTRPPYSGDYADPRGLVISDGIVVADRPKGRGPMFVVRKNGTVEIADNLVAAEYQDVLVAHSGQTLVRRDGKDVVPADRIVPSSRLAIGLSADKRYLFIVSVDNGVKFERGTGATHHDLNDIFADLGVSDAMVTDDAPSNALVVKDREKGYEILNRFATGAEPGAVFASVGIYLPDKRQKSVPGAPAVVETPAVTAKIQQSRLAVRRDKKPAETVLTGQVRVSLNTDLPRFKRPILNVVALFDVKGEWRYYDALVCDQKIWHGVCLDRDQTPARISNGQPEVTVSVWEKPVYGDPKVGFLHGYGVPVDKAKLVAYRLELWQAGKMLVAYDSDKNAVKRLGAPEDWYVKGKYGGKISYRWPPPKPAK